MHGSVSSSVSVAGLAVKHHFRIIFRYEMLNLLMINELQRVWWKSGTQKS